MNELDFNSSKPPYNNHHHIHNHHFTANPWYNDRADYNTNAPSYYDYLARYNMTEELIKEILNRLLRRNIEVIDTNCIDLTKEGDWIDNGTCDTGTGILPNNYDDVIKLQAEVILSKIVKDINIGETIGLQKIKNAIECLEDGLFAPDYTDVLKKIDQTLTILINAQGSSGVIEVPRDIDSTTSNNLADGLDLGKYEDDTNIEITWHIGSTRGTNKYRAGDLKGNGCHLTGWNMIDSSEGSQQIELFTKIFTDGKLYATGANKLYMEGASTRQWTVNKSSQGVVYYDTVNPDYKANTGKQKHEMIIERVTVYDRVKIG